MEQDVKAMYDQADKFINLANEIFKTDKTGMAGVAIRFAAARFSAFEASLRSADLAAEKDNMLQLYADDFTNMLRSNIEDYIKIQQQNRG